MKRLEHIQEYVKSQKSKIKALLLRQQWKEALVFLFFVFLSLGFWILQSLQEEYEVTISIPVRYRNIPPDISFTQTPPNKINARLKDKGSVLLNYSFGRIFASIEVNMKNTSSSENGMVLVTRRDLENDITKQLLASTNLVDFSPQQIEINYSKRMEVTVPVVFGGKITTAPGYAISGDIIINPPNVTVFTNEAVVDTLTEVKTIFTELKNINKTTTRILQLQKPEESQIEPTNVSVTIPIEEFTEKTIEIPIVFKNIPRRYTIRAFPSVVTVTTYLPLSRYKDVTENDFKIEIPFREVENNTSGILPILLSEQPDWIKNISIYPEQIEFILEQNSVE